MIKVVKFGGSSLASATQFAKVGNIIKADPERKFVVPSAPGKRNSKDTKVTDMLYACYDLAEAEKDFSKELKKIKERYEAIINGLHLTLSLDDEFETIEENFKKKAGSQYAASRGEYLNGIIMANYLGYDFVDSAEVIIFNEDGSFDADTTDKLLGERLSKLENAVVPGFYGATLGGVVKTFSRGGSDITGSLVSKAVHATAYENWTDVSGFLIADPRIIDNPKPIKVITYRELRELSYMGATVLHEDAIFPVRVAGIPINIKNTNRPNDKGTMIVKDAKSCTGDNVVTGIAGKKGFSTIVIEKDMMNSEVGFGKKVLDILTYNKVSFEHLPSSIDSMSIIVSSEEIKDKKLVLADEITKAVHPDYISIDDGIALVAVVGRNMANGVGTAYRVFKAVAEAGVNIKMIDQGSSEMNIIIGVREEDYQATLQGIYKEFVK